MRLNGGLAGLPRALRPRPVLQAQPGEPQFARIREDGWTVEVVFRALATGQVVSLTPDAAPKLVFLVTSPGFDEAGDPTTISRQVVATRNLLRPYPDQANGQEDANGGNARVIFTLSDYVHQGDLVSPVTFLAGAYGTSTFRILASANNDSQIPAPKVMADWVIAPMQRVGAGESLDVEVVAFNHFARNGKPVACVKITGTPASGAPVTRTATFVKSGRDQLPVYKATFTSADFTAGQLVTFTFEALPWVGDAASRRDSSGGAFPSISAPSTPQQHYWGAAPRNAIVYVSTAGNDGTGAIGTTLAAAKAAPYATISAAIQAMTTAGSDLAGARCVIGPGTHNWPAASTTGTRTALTTYFTIEGDPDDADPYNNCIVQTVGTTNPAFVASGAGTMSWVRVRNLRINLTAGNYGLFGGNSNRTTFWLDNLRMVSSVTTNDAFSLAALFYVTGGSYTSASASATLLQGTGTNRRFHLIRGASTNRRVDANVVVGTVQDASSIAGLALKIGESTNQRTTNLIAFNVRALSWLGNSSGFLALSGATANADVALVQCEFNASDSATNPLIAFGENYTAAPLSYVNMLFDYVSTQGGADTGALRMNVHNDPSGPVVAAPTDPQASYRHFAIKRSKLKWLAVKDDAFIDEVRGPNGNLVQGWQKRYGVGWHDNSSAYPAATFTPDFFGLNSALQSAGPRTVPAGDSRRGLTWDIDGATRNTNGSGTAGAVELVPFS